MTVHRIVMVFAGVHLQGCAGCPGGQVNPENPHNIVVLCSCGQRCTGRHPHTWTVRERQQGRIWLYPSFNWIDPRHPLHDFIQGVPEVASESDLPLRSAA